MKRGVHVLLDVTVLVVMAISTLSNGLAQSRIPANLGQMALEMEQAFAQGQSRLSQRDQLSLLTAAVAYVPELQGSARIAGTEGPIADNGSSGFYGGVFFGPIPVDNHRLDYVKMTVWGNEDLGWKFEHLTRHAAVQSQEHPAWFWLTEPVTETQAAEIVRQLRQMSAPANRETPVPLTRREIDLVNRFERRVEAAAVLEREGSAEEWYANYPLIAGCIQVLGSRPYACLVAVNFAMIGDELRFIDVRRRQP